MIPEQIVFKESPVSSKTPYIAASVIMALLGVVAFLGIVFLRPNDDNVMLITVILGFLTTITTGILAYMKSQETHVSVNSRMDEWRKESSLAIAKAHAAGIKEGQGAELLRASLVQPVAVIAVTPVVSIAKPAETGKTP